MDNLFHQSPVTTNTQEEISNVTNERQISSDSLAEMIKGFNELTIKSTIKNSVYYGSEEVDAESDPNSYPNLATHTTNGNDPHKLLINWLISDISSAATPPIDQTIAEDSGGSGETLHACCTILSKDIVTDAARSAAHVF